MFRKIKNKRGFTLVEMLVAMAIFVIFVSVLMNSYTSIVVNQRAANDYRVMYSDSRRVFEILVAEFRDGMLDYGEYNSGCSDGTLRSGIQEVFLISKDARDKTQIRYDSEGVSLEMRKGRLAEGQNPTSDPDFGEFIRLNSENVMVTDFKVYPYPFVDVYDQQYSQAAYQFHPFVTVFATFEMDRGNRDPFKIDLQTTVSSRVYNQIYSTGIKCI